MNKWIWKVRTYKDGEFMLETVHASDQSKDMEVEAAKKIGRDVEVINISEGR
jgi:hypothetical protein